MPLMRAKLSQTKGIDYVSCEVDENCALMSYYAASSGNVLPTFRYQPDNGADIVPERR
jgi:hypothetical protein